MRPTTRLYEPIGWLGKAHHIKERQGRRRRLPAEGWPDTIHKWQIFPFRLDSAEKIKAQGLLLGP
jgi:hypothetical protein